jgi:hypothetical protein
MSTPEYRRHCREAGICIDCSARLDKKSTLTMCAPCADHKRRYSKERRDRFRKASICIVCRGRLQTTKKGYSCQSCAAVKAITDRLRRNLAKRLTLGSTTIGEITVLVTKLLDKTTPSKVLPNIDRPRKRTQK